MIGVDVETTSAASVGAGDGASALSVAGIVLVVEYRWASAAQVSPVRLPVALARPTSLSLTLYAV